MQLVVQWWTVVELTDNVVIEVGGLHLRGQFWNFQKISSIFIPQNEVKLYKIGDAMRLIYLSSHHALVFVIDEIRTFL